MEITLANIHTPLADKMLQVIEYKPQPGVNLAETITHGQKVIMETILGRRAPDGSGRNRIHVMAHTRYGKSMTIGGGVATRASMKKERWAIIAPTEVQAQIIMDYVIATSVNDPLISKLLDPVLAKNIRVEQLTQRRNRNHITYIGGGEVRCYHAKNLMGFGSPNVVLDEAGLIDNETESKIFRMMADNADDYFYVKVGNPFFSLDVSGEEHHFSTSYSSTKYYHLNIDSKVGIAEGRLTQEYLDEAKDKPNYDILYNNIFPDTELADAQGFYPLISPKKLNEAFITEEQASIYDIRIRQRLGGDPADGGENEHAICLRSPQLARIVLASTKGDSLDFADDVVKHGQDAEVWSIDKQGVSTGTINKLKRVEAYNRRLNPVNAGDKLPEKMKEGEIPAREVYQDVRAYMFWNVRNWVLGGGKIVLTDKLKRQLSAVRYKNNIHGQLQIIKKEELRKRGVDDLGQADALSFTFAPVKPKMKPHNGVIGGVDNMLPGGVADVPRSLAPTLTSDNIADALPTKAPQQPTKKDKYKVYIPNL